jgi:hypothetical protein
MDELEVQRMQTLAKAAYRLLRYAGVTFNQVLDWNFLYTILLMPDVTTRCYAAEALALQLQMSDSEREKFLAQHRPPPPDDLLVKDKTKYLPILR